MNSNRGIRIVFTFLAMRDLKFRSILNEKSRKPDIKVNIGTEHLKTACCIIAFVRSNIELPVLSKGMYGGTCKTMIPYIKTKRSTDIRSLTSPSNLLNIVTNQVKVRYTCCRKPRQKMVDQPIAPIQHVRIQ